MEGSVGWDILLLLVGAIVAVGLGVGGFVGAIVWWLAREIRAVDHALAKIAEKFSVHLANTRHGLRNEMQREAGKTDMENEARRKEIQDLEHRITRLEERVPARRTKS